MAWHDIVGTLGVSIIIVAYAATQMRRLKPEHLMYSVANLVGAAMTLVSLAYNFNLASVIIEIFWILISLWGIVLWLRHRRAESPSENP